MGDNALAFTAIGAAAIDDRGRQWIEVMPTAEKARNNVFFTVTADDLAAYADWIRTHPEKIPIDYDHGGAYNGRSTKAAGWFTGDTRITQDAARGAILEAEVQWTPDGATSVRNGDYRFISPEFSFHDRDAKTGLLTRAKALLAATLTNRPFFRQLAALAADAGDDDPAVTLLTEAFALDRMELFTVLSASDAPYGDVDYADPGLQKDGKKRYPLDTDEHIRAAWSYINQAKNGGMYSAEQLTQIKSKIRAAMKRIGADVTTTNEGAEMELKVVAAALGLPEDATEEQVTEAVTAAKKTADELETAKAEIVELKAKAGDADRIKKLEDDLAAERKLRVDNEIENTLTAAVTARKIDPAQKTVLAEQYDGNADGLKKLLETFTPRPVTARGTGAGNGGEDGDVDLEPVVIAGMATPVGEDGARLHTKAVAALTAAGKTKYTADEYMSALEQAQAALAAA